MSYGIYKQLGSKIIGYHNRRLQFCYFTFTNIKLRIALISDQKLKGYYSRCYHTPSQSTPYNKIISTFLTKKYICAFQYDHVIQTMSP